MKLVKTDKDNDKGDDNDRYDCYSRPGRRYYGDRYFRAAYPCVRGPWRMDARPSGSYRCATEKSKIVVNGVDEFKCHGEITEIDPPRLLVYTWFGNWHFDRKRKTVVRWELTPTATGRHVKVTDSGLAREPAARADYSGGWTGALENLKQFAEGEKE